MAITNGYCTLADVKSALRLTDNTDDALIENAIEGASRRIDGYCGRFFYQTAQTAITMYPFDSYNQPVENDISTTSVTVKTDDNGDGVFETTWTQGVDYQLEPLNATLQGRPYRRIVAIGGKTFPLQYVPNRPLVQVTAQWGWASIPDDVREACILLAMRGFARLNAALGVVGFADMAIQVRAVDPDVRDLLNPYKIIGIA
jgi:hypothetical protein